MVFCLFVCMYSTEILDPLASLASPFAPTPLAGFLACSCSMLSGISEEMEIKL